MNTILDNIYGLVVRPVKTLEDVTSGEKLKEGIIIWLFVILLMTLSSFKAGAGIVTQFIGTIIVRSQIIFPDFWEAEVRPGVLRQDLCVLLYPMHFPYFLLY